MSGDGASRILRIKKRLVQHIEGLVTRVHREELLSPALAVAVGNNNVNDEGTESALL